MSSEPVPGVIQRGATAEDELKRAARVAGLRGFVVPTLERIDRRRVELLGLTFVVLIFLAAGTVLLPFVEEVPTWFFDANAALPFVRIGLVLLIFGFMVYVIDKERQLRKLSKYVINEQVLGAALSNRLKELSLLSEAGKAVSSTLELEDVLHVILNAASELLESDEGSVMLVEGDELVVAAAHGHPQLFVGARQSLDHGIAGYVARTREPLLLEGGSGGGDGESGAVPAPEILSAMSVPLDVRSELLGVLNLNVRDGSRRYTEYELRALGLFGEHAAMAIRHARTMRREREMRMHVAEIDRLRTELVGSMAHDLKTPLTSILGVAKLLAERAGDIDEQKQKDFLLSIRRQAERLLTQIERLLDAARSQAQHLPLEPAPLDVPRLLEDTAQSFRNAFGRAITVEAPHRVQAFADSTAFEQVVANLLENAVKHTPADAQVKVSVDVQGPMVRVTVRDDGPGIAPELIPDLFVPFRRGSDRGSGTGLGLFVVANLVRAMGGEISVDSEPGRGTAFTFTLPVYPPP